MGERLGQHFLTNKRKIKEIIEALELKDGDIIIEIGAGHGELTNELLAFSFKLLGVKIIAIEKDPELATRISSLGHRDIEVITGDALKIIPEITKSHTLYPKSYKIVGNIPYYITGYLLRVIGELENKPELTILTIQKEVAERICAKPPKMNLLAVSVQFWAIPEIIGYISRGDFEPKPKVESAIMRLQIAKLQDCKITDYYNLIKILFKQPRKTIVNNLTDSKLQIHPNLQIIMNKKGEIAELLQKVGINPNDRPQNLSVEKIIELMNILTIKH